MEMADRCRHAALEAVADVEPDGLSDFVEAVLDTASMTPAIVAVETARRLGDVDLSDEASFDPVGRHAAGVLLIYEGLALTRQLAHDEPWAARESADQRGDGSEHSATREPAQGDLEILAADILVARGFYLLARSTAADKAVRTVRAFGRDQSRRREAADPTAYDLALERDVLELAVLAGAASVDRRPTPQLFSLAETLLDEDAAPGFPPAPELPLDPLPLDESATTDRATSVSDP